MLKWEYVDENICTDRPVARLVKEDGTAVLYVMEDRAEQYTNPVSDLIKSFRISYATEKSISKEEEKDGTNEVLKKRLVAGCEKIQENYEEQVKQLVAKANSLT